MLHSVGRRALHVRRLHNRAVPCTDRDPLTRGDVLHTAASRASASGESAARAQTALHNPDISATIVSMTVEPLRDVRNHFSEVVDRVEHEHERVTVTRNGRPVAIIISPEDLEALEETLAVLSDPDALADIREADAAYAAGDVIRGTDAIRALRP